MSPNNKGILFSLCLNFISLLTMGGVGFSADEEIGSETTVSFFTTPDRTPGQKVTLEKSWAKRSNSTVGGAIAGLTVENVLRSAEDELRSAGIAEDLTPPLKKHIFARPAKYFPILPAEPETIVAPSDGKRHTLTTQDQGSRTDNKIVFEVYILPFGEKKVVEDKNEDVASVERVNHKELNLELEPDYFLLCHCVKNPSAIQDYLVKDIYQHLRSLGYEIIELKFNGGRSLRFCDESKPKDSADYDKFLDGNETIRQQAQSRWRNEAGESLDTIGGSVVDGCSVGTCDNDDSDKRFDIHAFMYSSPPPGSSADDS